MLALVCGYAYSQEPITSIATVRALPMERAREKRSVELEATVTYHDLLLKDKGIYVHDGHDGIYMRISTNHVRGISLMPGSRLRIRAQTDAGSFIPVVNCQSVENKGIAPLPDAMVVKPDNLFLPTLDAQWVKVAGLIVGTEQIVDGQFVFVMQVYGWTVKLLMPVSEELLREAPNLMQRRVTFEGVAATVFNAQKQMTGRFFFIPSLAFIRLDKEVPLPLSVVVSDVDQLLHSDVTMESRVRVQGVITHATKSMLYLRGKGGSIRMFVATRGDFSPGDRVEAEGYAFVAPFRPELRATDVKLLGKEAIPAPILFRKQEKELANLQAELMVVVAEYLGHRDNPEATVLQCRAGEQFFEALLPKSVLLPRDWVPGSTLRLTGICELTTIHPLPRTQWVDGFRLHLRSADDLVVLDRPSWWTAGRLLAVLGVVAGLALAALAWGWMLRKRVLSQTAIIGTQLQRDAVLGERQRLARDFHDTLEQELTGIAIQLDNVDGRFESSPGKAREALQLARQMLRYCREEVRTSISDLRCVLLEHGGLESALREALSAIVDTSSAAFTFNVSGTPFRIDSAIENHLLRMAREAVTNAVRHSAAAHIIAELTFSPRSVCLSISDDGQGFDATLRPPRGHFGLMGMHERAKKIGASLQLESKPGAGTTVRVTVSEERLHRAEDGGMK